MTELVAPPAAPRHRPVEIAPETFVIQATVGEGVAPQAIHMNSMLIRGEEPVVVDTGCPIHREQYLDDLFGLVDPEAVRWVFISHDDIDHTGNLNALMEMAPNATVIKAELQVSDDLEIVPAPTDTEINLLRNEIDPTRVYLR